MPLYKMLPRRKDKILPFNRPVDRLLVGAWKSRRQVGPILLVIALAILALGIFKLVRNNYESKASSLFSEGGDLSRVAREYPRSRVAALARVQLGAQALKDGKYDEAVQWYRKEADDSHAPAVIRISALHNLALASLKKGDFDRSLQVLDRAIHDPKNSVADYSRLLLARTYEVKGDQVKAVELYKSLSEGAEAPAIQQEAKERTTWLQPKESK